MRCPWQPALCHLKKQMTKKMNAIDVMKMIADLYTCNRNDVIIATIIKIITIGTIKLLLSIYYLRFAGKRMKFPAFILIQGLIFIYLLLAVIGIFNYSIFGILLILLAELANRIFYYMHFEPKSFLNDYYSSKLKLYEEETNK
jgi:hypothetical protein